MASVAARKKSIVSSSGIQIDTPVANNTLLNKAASTSTSLYQQCSQLRTRLLRIKGFDYYFCIASSPPDSRQFTDPVTHVWDLFSLGISLCYLVDLLPADQGFTKINNSMFDPDKYDANPDRAKKRAIALFAMQIKDKISAAIPGCELFTVTDLWDRNSTDGLVKVVRTVTAIVNHLPENAFEEPPPSTPSLSSHESLDSILDSLPPVNAQDSARQNIVREIVETERKYVQDLEVMQKYSNALYQNNIIDQDTIHLLFPNLNNLLNFQRKFLIRLESTAEHPWPEQRWGLDFLESEEEFIVYEPYCANYTNASELMLAHEQSLAALNHLINVKGELPAFLIKPVQRVCKYPLLLDSLIKAASPSAYPHCEELKLGSEAAKRIADKINEAQRRAENDQTVKNLQARVEDWKGHHIANFGELLLDDIFLVTKSDVDREYHVFLFEKIILCCKEVPPNAQNGNKKGSKNNSLLKKQASSAPLPLLGSAQIQRKNTPLVLKGRIFLGNVTQAISVPARTIGASGIPTQYPLQVWWKGDDDLEYFTLRCRREDQMRQWESQINKLIKELAQRRAMERTGLSKMAMPTCSNSTLSRVSSLSHMQQSAFSQMPACNGRYSRPSLGTPTIGDENILSPGLPIGAFTSSSLHSHPPHDSFEFEVDDEELEDYPPASSYTASGRGTPMGGRRSTLGDRESMNCERADSQWKVPLPPNSAASIRPLTPRLHSVPSMHSDCSFGNPSRVSRPLRNQLSSTRLKSTYTDNGDYYNGCESPNLGVPSNSRSRSVSQPTAYAPKTQLPPIPAPAVPQSQWNRDRSSTSVSGGVTSSSRNKRGSGSSQSTGDSSDYSPNSSSSPITPYGSSESSLGGVGIRTQPFESIPNDGGYHTFQSSPPVKVKIFFHEDVFVIEVPRHTEYEELVEKVGRKIRLCGPRRDDGPLRVKYRDEDGDMVLLGSTEDVQIAFAEFRAGGQVTLFVT